jgi:hypothetical protein
MTPCSVAVAGISAVAPSRTAASAVRAASATVKYASQYGGIAAGITGGRGSSTETLRPPSCQSRRFRGP